MNYASSSRRMAASESLSWFYSTSVSVMANWSFCIIYFARHETERVVGQGLERYGRLRLCSPENPAHGAAMDISVGRVAPDGGHRLRHRGQIPDVKAWPNVPKVSLSVPRNYLFLWFVLFINNNNYVKLRQYYIVSFWV